MNEKIKYYSRYIFLIFFVILGFYSRTYHLDFPPIGYHNMKENEYLSIALGHYERGDYLRRTLLIFGMDEGPGYFEEYPQMPLIPWVILILWKLFGIKLWLARLQIVIFSVLTIPFIYLLTKRLTNNEYLSMLSSFLYTIMPISVFFGRNIQPESPALFFSMFAIYFYLKWLDRFERKDCILFSIGLGFVGLYKYTFLIILIPMLAIFPFKELIDKKARMKIIKQSLYVAILGFFPWIAWLFISKALNVKETVFGGTLPRVSLFRIFTLSYWQEFWPAFSGYFRDNWTWYFFFFSIFGILLLLTKYKTRLGKFTIAYAISVIPYSMILSDYIKAHSYYQMPFVPLVVISSAYFIYVVGDFLRQMIGWKYIKYASLILILIALPSVNSSINVQYDTIFYGLDTAGAFIKEKSNPNERFFIAGHAQSVGVCFSAMRRCAFIPEPENLSLFKFGEEKRNMSWIFIHGDYGMLKLQQMKETWKYVQENYRIEQIGLFKTEKGFVPVYFVLRKGGTFNLTEMRTKPVILKKVYDTTKGPVNLYTIER